MHFLTYFQDKKLGTYFKYLLETTFPCEVRLVESGQDFINELNDNVKYSLFLFASKEQLIDLDLVLFESRVSNMPGVYVCEDKKNQVKAAKVLQRNNITFLDNLTEIQQVLKRLADKVGIIYELNEVKSNYIQIKKEYLLKLNKTHCDIFIKLSEIKYLKIINEGSDFTSKEILNILSKETAFFYVRTNDFELFLNSINAFEKDYSQLTSKEAQEIIVNDLIFSQDIFFQLSNHFGFNQKTINYINLSMNLLNQLIDRDDKIKSIWDSLIARKNFLSEHTLMVAYLANAILSQTSHATNSNSVKLSLAAILHDVGLIDEKQWELEKCDNKEEGFSTREIQKFHGHQQQAVDLMNKIDDIPEDIGKILLNHHESYDGSGFPRGVGWSKIPLLASIFIVAHEFVIYMYKNKCSNEELVEYVNLMKNQYQEGYFKEAILALEKTRF